MSVFAYIQDHGTNRASAPNMTSVNTPVVTRTERKCVQANRAVLI